MFNSYAVVVGIEKYQQAGIRGIDYAHADARGFRDVLIERMEVPKDNVELWLDKDATRPRFEQDLKYNVQQLGPDDRFYFFYAGHGLWAPKGGNRLTTWDSHPDNLPDTTVSLEDVLLGPLREGECKRSAVFIDACAAEIGDKPHARDLVKDMSEREFEEFIKESDYTAAFFSCSAKEKSYPAPALEHGVWTYLLRALRGDEPAAVVKDKWVTGESLQNYLKKAVAKYTREKMSVGGRQRPYALIGANGSFPIATIPTPPAATGTALLEPDFSEAYFAGEETKPFRSLPGFTWKKRHTVPDSHTDSATAWARRLLSAEVAEELQTVYRHAKKILKLKSHDVDKQEETGVGTVDTDAFRFSIEAGQSGDDPADAVVRREIRLRVPHTELPEDFDAIFPGTVDEFVVPVPGIKGRYAELIDAIEDGTEVTGADADGDPTKGVIEVRLHDGTNLSIDTKREMMVVRVAGGDGCLSMIEQLAAGDLPNLAGRPPRMIGRRS
jgi:hypothetical protein